jgi:PTS system nitrogen regulatory IIA component
MNFWKQFKPKSCSLDLSAGTKPLVLAEVVETMVASDALPADFKAAALEALVERERAGSTGVGMNVAIPHVKLKGLERAACSLSVHIAGVEWQAVDGAPVHLLFTVLRPEKAATSTTPRSTSR